MDLSPQEIAFARVAPGLDQLAGEIVGVVLEELLVKLRRGFVFAMVVENTAFVGGRKWIFVELRFDLGPVLY